jgi:hypothetical protein
VEKLGAGSRTERVEMFSEPALQLVGSHAWRLRCRTVARVLACLSVYIREPWRCKY